MMDLIKRVLRDCFTGIDGESYNPVRIIGYSSCTAAVIVYLGNAIYLAMTKATFDFVAFSSGFSVLMGGLLAVGAAEAIKVKTEPPAKP